MNKIKNILNSPRKRISLLAGILAVGFLIYVLAMFLRNIFMVPEAVMTQQESMELFEQRAAVRIFAENVNNITSLIYMIGVAYLVYGLVKSRTVISVKKTAAWACGIMTGLLGCAGIFALMDREFAGDYFFPIWGVCCFTAGAALIVMIISLIRGSHKRGNSYDRKKTGYNQSI